MKPSAAGGWFPATVVASLAKASPRALEGHLQGRSCSNSTPSRSMDALVRLREAPGILGVSLRSGEPPHLRA